MTDNQIFNDTFFAMGTRCDIVFTDLENEFAEQMFQLVKKEVVYLEKILSRFIPTSAVAEINNADKNKWLTVPEDLWNAIALCFDFYQMSNGAFDITAGPIINLWKKKSGESAKVSKKEIIKALEKSGFHRVDLDFEKKRLRYTADNMELDFGAIGKGIAIDRIKPLLERSGVKNGIVSFGESSILALGKHPNGGSWPLGIRNSFQPNEYVHVFSANNECVTTSGIVVNNDDGQIKWRNHIISPVYGYPVEENKLVSVKSQSASLGEFISTTWLILPEEDKNILAEQLKDIEILEAEYTEEKEFKTKLTVI
ncbi:FAD:protein FMN transferase [Maribellus maritimus]|uniref:FAD:protein FMN transferase n=1 Tax=Maribellus maritimus TaxID=2870838 RepID=UPI001EEBC12F|nr:FAD:protein FMN transferase [Maribellus maritimus]MCG6190611.1 FAD:protein FMN transferase [Maribellus maritimus]